MKKILFLILLSIVLLGCRKHVFHTYYGDIDIDTMEIAFYDLKDSLPCYQVFTQDKDSVEKAPGVWEYIEGPLLFFYCPAKNTYYHTFPDYHGNQILRGYAPKSEYSCDPYEF